MLRYGGHELWFTVWAGARLKVLERRATSVDAHQCIADVSNDLFQFHIYLAG